MISYADLGGLGAREGVPVACMWEPPPEPVQTPVAISIRISPFLSLLILLPLFLFRQNRCSAAWWIWLPVVVCTLAETTITCLMTGNEWSLAQAVGSFILGLGATWLLMPFLGSRYRIVTFFKALPVLAGFSLLAFVPTLLANRGWLYLRPPLAALLDFASLAVGSVVLRHTFGASLAVLLALASLSVMLALTFGGLSVRRRFGRIRFLVWLAVWTVAAWAVIAWPFVTIGLFNSDVEFGASLLAILSASTISLALLLPLVLLSFLQPFYRARLSGFLKIPQAGGAIASAIPPKLPEVNQPTQRPAPAGATD